MYFQIENTPEHIRKAQRTQNVPKELPKEECPCLILAPFSRPPQVVFDNVLIGSTCERTLELINPSKQVQRITLGKALPHGLVIQLPAEWLELEPSTCYTVTLMWTPIQPTAMREIIRFTNDNRGRFDVIVVLKSVMNIKGKGAQPKGFKISPGKIKKKINKKSPVTIYKTKSEIIHNTTQIKRSINVIQSQQKVSRVIEPEKLIMGDYSIYSSQDKCPFDSPNSIDFNFDTSEVFSSIRKPEMLHHTYDKSYNSYNNPNVPLNILKPSNKQVQEANASELFDNQTFTPLKIWPLKTDKLNKGPQVILSMNSENDFEDKKYCNKENETHSIICVTSSQPPNRWLTVDHTQTDSHIETSNNQNKKHPNTSSPKEMNSPNFSINTEYSRISDLSFLPQRFSMDRKGLLRMVNDTHEINDDPIKLSSDTYTKESPNTPMEYNYNQIPEMRPPYFHRHQPKMCKQALFRENHQGDANDKISWNTNFEHNIWRNDVLTDVRSPPKSITPPLQSIPEESVPFSDTHVFDCTDKLTTTFTMNRTFNKSNMSTKNRESWSKKAVRAEPDLWKIPITHIKKTMKNKHPIKSKDSLSCKKSNVAFEDNSISLNISVNQIGNVYTQSFTVDPFLSSTYFYDELAVNKFENEFKRWLNYILTPPADLDSNVEQKVDVGKAWVENRNKEIPAAPTREQVSSVYHNSHRLESVRRSARTLLMTPEITQVIQKVNAQIEKKLIAIRTDRNLHLDVGLQKAIMELLLSYNPLWLRIGLETIYNIVLPLKSNSDIEGLTTFIIHRMFKNPFLRNKHSKSSTPNMLLPAYIEAIKKFTLKKFFMLVFFLDQAKQRKLISHDPCLFCRNAVCKESREVLIRFTRELIAGIGDITKHLRPLGYVVSHRQSYLDEYKYAVHNIAVDIRDGVRLTRVMEIILMKDGLLKQLRTPPISRLQKIHNVQVALKALKDVNFAIVGDITAVDIAEGHREKTLSLLWQIIHVFRAPLFEKAANVIQNWWKKKYEVIMEKKKEAERILQEQNHAASVIQTWWRRFQYNRYVEMKMHQITIATITIQKYCRMWLCRTRLITHKSSVLKIEEWYKSIKMMKQAKATLERLRFEKEQIRHYSATVIQSYVRRWMCMKQYRLQIKKIVLIQSIIRRFLARNNYLKTMKAVTNIQQRYRGKIQMRTEMKYLIKARESAVLIQSYYRMLKHRRNFLKLKHHVKVIENRYVTLLKMRNERKNYLELKKNVITIQTLFRKKICRKEYLRRRVIIIFLQNKIRAHQLMKKTRAEFLKVKNSATKLQINIKAYLAMKKVRREYIKKREAAIVIQRYFRSCVVAKLHREVFVRLRNASTILQKSYRNLVLMRKQRLEYLKIKNACITLQRKYKAQIIMKQCRREYIELRKACITLQRKFRALIEMREQRSNYLKLKLSCIFIQNMYRSFAQAKRQRNHFLNQKQAAVLIQNWFRNCKKGKETRQQYEHSKQTCITIQRIYRARIIGRKHRQEFVRLRTATIRIQKYYRSYIEMKIVRKQFIELKTATITIQKYYKSHLDMKKQRTTYLQMKTAAVLISIFYKQFKETRLIRQHFCQLRTATIHIQNRYRSVCVMKQERENFLKTIRIITAIQKKYKALLSMRKERRAYLRLKSSVIIIQRRFRARILMKQQRTKYIMILNACSIIQTHYRAFLKTRTQRETYLNLRQAAIILQRRYKALCAMRVSRNSYLKKLSSTIVIQRWYKSHCLMRKYRNKYLEIMKACITIQRKFRAYLCGRRLRDDYNNLKSAVILIQRNFRLIRHHRKVQAEYQILRSTVILIQRRFRSNKIARTIRSNEAATKIQNWYSSIRKRDICRREFIKVRTSCIIIQSMFRMYIMRKRFTAMRNSALTIQRYYRSNKLMTKTRQEYFKIRTSVIKVQSYVRTYVQRKQYLRVRAAVLTIQAAYRFKRNSVIIKQSHERAAICLQKHFRRYIVQSRYLNYKKNVILIQKIWRGKLLTRLNRCEFMQKREIIIKLQSVIRGYLVRRFVRMKMDDLRNTREEQRRHWAASIIQALFRGNSVRAKIAHDKCVTDLRHRWRNGALESKQATMQQRKEEALDVLRNMSDIETVIKAFRSLELLTEVFPMMHIHNASSIVHRIYTYMSATNRSIPSIEVLKSAAAILVNLTRYKSTGPKIYLRDRIAPILKFMLRFSNSEPQLFCIMATYLWLFSKYEHLKEDLTEFLNTPENRKVLVAIKQNVGRMKRMSTSILKNKNTPQMSKFVCHTHNQNASVHGGNNCNILLPALEPDYGIVRAEKPRYFENAQQAIDCLFRTYKL